MSSSDEHLLSRRKFCLCCVASATFATSGGWLSPRQVFAKAQGIVDMIRDDAAKAPINLHSLRGGINILEGSGGNIAVLAKPDGKLLVDAGITASKPRILDALARLGDQPIRQLINTHWHFDHADGNEWLNAQGAAILAHENTRKHLLSAQRVDDWDFDFPPSPLAATPSQVMSDTRSLDFGGETLLLQHHPAAHTDGDISITFSNANVVHAGDIYWNGIYPFIDHSTGGGINGTIKAAEAILAIANAGTIIIPGHGNPVSNRSELRAYRDMLVAIRDRIATAKAQGKSLEEIIAAKPTGSFDDKWGKFVIGPDFFVKLVHEGV